jgi:hypothetical protein
MIRDLSIGKEASTRVNKKVEDEGPRLIQGFYYYSYLCCESMPTKDVIHGVEGWIH